MIPNRSFSASPMFPGSGESPRSGGSWGPTPFGRASQRKFRFAELRRKVLRCRKRQILGAWRRWDSLVPRPRVYQDGVAGREMDNVRFGVLFSGLNI